MAIIIKEVTDQKTIHDFVSLPYRLYRNHPYWVAPMRKDEENAIKSQTNPAFEYCKAKFWVAYHNNQCVGRIGAIIIDLWNEKNNQKYGRFSRTEFIDDKSVSSELFKVAEEWLRSKGME